MRIVLLGKDGQVGWELQRSLLPLGEVVALGRGDVDLADARQLDAVVDGHAPDVIVNAAAYTAVDKAESEPAVATAINAAAPGVLAAIAARRQAWLIHYSTDYVFDGRKQGAYTEDDGTNPLSVYGRSKLQGEEAIRDSGCRHLIFRTAWVFSARGGNFARTMLRLAKEREQLKVVADQFGAPTSAELIADVTALCLHQLLGAGGAKEADAARLGGLYHLVAAGECTWHEYASFVIARAAELGAPLKAGVDQILPIPSSEFPTPAARPANSRLATDRLRKNFALRLPHWHQQVQRMLDETLGA